MRAGLFRAALILLCVTFAARAQSAPRRAQAPRPPERPFPAPPTLSLVRVVVSREHVLVLEDVLLRRGDWTSGDLDAFVAFGSPGVPRAVDARLYPAATEDDDPPGDATPFEPIPLERAVRRPPRARLLVGSGAMAGAVLHLREAAFRHATAASGVARVRVRTLIDLPQPDVLTGRELVIRLGAHEGEPYALDAIEVTSDDSRPFLTHAEARLCGPAADPWPLALRTEPSLTPIAPVLSVRHATDDLCIRFWTTADPTPPPSSEK